MQCKICKKEFSTSRRLSNHIKIEHNISSSDYYLTYIDSNHSCEVCGKPTNFHNLTLGFYKHCSRQCINKSNLHKKSVAKTKKERYNNSSYNNPEKISKVLSNRSEEEKQSFIKKSKSTKLTKYGNSNYNNMKKRNITMKRNNSYKSSKLETKCYDLLRTKFTVERNYFDEDRYPFACDFYLYEIDTFIEINNHWSHNTHLFSNSIEDNNILDIWKEKAKYSNYYSRAIKVWSIEDVQRYNTAKRNKLNYLIFYTEKEFLEWFNSIS